MRQGEQVDVAALASSSYGHERKHLAVGLIIGITVSTWARSQ
jgi:hypothetical protein